MLSHEENRQNAIELDRIVKRFGNSAVLNELCLKIPDGSFSILLGASGSGKTTIARIIAGLEPPTSGRVRIFGVDQTSVPPHQRPLALVFQNGNAYEHLTVQQNLNFIPKQQRVAASSLGDERIVSTISFEQVVEELELGELLQRKPPQLSGGQLQRLAIARAILLNRRIWILDEPLAHLDESVRHQIRSMLIDQQRRYRITVLYVTHDSDEAMQLASHVGVLHHGAIAQFDEPDRVFNSPVSIEVGRALGQPPMALLASIDVHGHRVHVGVRPIDWTVTRYDRSGGVPSHADESNHAIKLIEGSVEMSGVVHAAKYMGRQWWIWVRCAGNDKPILASIPCRDESRELGEMRSDNVASGETAKTMAGSTCDRTLVRDQLIQDCKQGVVGGFVTLFVPRQYVNVFAS